MFDLLSVIRRHKLTRCTHDRMVATARDPQATDAERDRAREDYLADLVAECEAAGLRVVEDNVVRPLFGRRRPMRPAAGFDGPEAA